MVSLFHFVLSGSTSSTQPVQFSMLLCGECLSFLTVYSKYNTEMIQSNYRASEKRCLQKEVVIFSYVPGGVPGGPCFFLLTRFTFRDVCVLLFPQVWVEILANMIQSK